MTIKSEPTTPRKKVTMASGNPDEDPESSSDEEARPGPSDRKDKGKVRDERHF